MHQAIETRHNTNRDFLWLVLIAICCAVPFLNKAVHIDDPLFLWTAKQIQAHPGDFYGFNVNWYGDEKPMSQITKNPPLASYYIAAVTSVFGWGIPILHAAFLLVTIGTVLGMYALARMFCAHPLEAVLAGMLTPVFLVSGTTIMCDMLMVGCWVWSTVLWVQGIKDTTWWKLLLAAMLIAVSALTKYFGMNLILLLACYTVVEQRRLSKFLAFLLIPVLLLYGYQWFTNSLYGRGLLFDAASYATDFRALSGKDISSGVFTGLAFAGGCFVTMLFYTFRLWQKRGLMTGTVLTAILFLLFASLGRFGPFPFPETTGAKMFMAAQSTLMVAAGIGLVALITTDYFSRRDAGSLLLVLWALGTILFAIIVNWSINGRSFLPIAPVFGILLMRRTERFAPAPHRRTLWYALRPLLPAACVALLVTYADYSLANTARAAATDVSAKYHDQTLWFQGHWGFQYYMESFGGKPVDYEKSQFSTGNIIVTPLNNTGVRSIPRNLGTLIDTLEYRPFSWVTPMNVYVGAGFYSDIWGPFPYVFGPVPSEKCFVLRVGQQ